MNDTRENIVSLISEAKNYCSLQTDYIRYAATERLTKALSKLALALIAVLVGIIILVFAGLALVHWVGTAIGDMGLCYAIYAGAMALLLLVVYLKRRSWIILPITRIVADVFIKTDKEEKDDERA